MKVFGWILRQLPPSKLCLNIGICLLDASWVSLSLSLHLGFVPSEALAYGCTMVQPYIAP